MGERGPGEVGVGAVGEVFGRDVCVVGAHPPLDVVGVGAAFGPGAAHRRLQDRRLRCVGPRGRHVPSRSMPSTLVACCERVCYCWRCSSRGCSRRPPGATPFRSGCRSCWRWDWSCSSSSRGSFRAARPPSAVAPRSAPTCRSSAGRASRPRRTIRSSGRRRRCRDDDARASGACSGRRSCSARSR